MLIADNDFSVDRVCACGYERVRNWNSFCLILAGFYCNLLVYLYTTFKSEYVICSIRFFASLLIRSLPLLRDQTLSVSKPG